MAEEEPHIGTDQTVVRDQYATSNNLDARASIYAFQSPPVDLVAAVLGAADWPSGAVVGDIGCGPGRYLAALATKDVQTIGVDISMGMAAEARLDAGATVAVGDAERLPFPDAKFDRLLAPHMLYHCPDIDAAVRELRRVLRPDGTAIVVTNGNNHLARIRQLRSVAFRTDPGMVFQRFSTAKAVPALRAHFDVVSLAMIRSQLIVPSSDPVVAYLTSARNMFEPSLRDDLSWDALMASIAEEVTREIANTGAFRCPTEVAVITCR